MEGNDHLTSAQCLALMDIYDCCCLITAAWEESLQACTGGKAAQAHEVQALATEVCRANQELLKRLQDLTTIAGRKGVLQWRIDKLAHALPAPVWDYLQATRKQTLAA